MAVTNQPAPVILGDADLTEIEARANAATEGPFDVLPVTTIDGDTAGFKWGRYLSDNRTADSFWDSELVPFEDATFYAHARTDIPALCQTVRALREQLYEEQRRNQVQAETIMEYERQLNHPAAAWANAPEHQENLAAKAKTLALLAREQAADQCTSSPDERETFLQGWDSATDYVRERFMEGSL